MMSNISNDLKRRKTETDDWNTHEVKVALDEHGDSDYTEVFDFNWTKDCTSSAN